MTTEAMFEEAFVLMDSEGNGRITLQDVYTFTDSQPNPPSHADVKAQYDKFDEDNSGDIDADEFRGLCDALAKLLRMTVLDMAQTFSQAQYFKLFNLVDDGGDGDNTISKDELKAFIETLGHTGITAIRSASDLISFLKEYPAVLNLDHFTDVIRKLCKGCSISRILSAFVLAKEQQEESREAARKLFGLASKRKNRSQSMIKPPEPSQTSSTVPSIPSPEPADLEPAPCTNCALKDEEISSLQDQVAELQGRVARVTEQLRLQTAASDEAANMIARVELRGNVWGGDEATQGSPEAGVNNCLQNIRAVLKNQLEDTRVFQAAQRTETSERFNDLMSYYLNAKTSTPDVDTMAKELQNMLKKLADSQRQYRAMVDLSAGAIGELRELCTKACHALEDELGDSEGKDALDISVDALVPIDLALGAVRGHQNQDTLSNLEWVFDTIVQLRTICVTSAVKMGPFAQNGLSLLKGAVAMEEGTKQLILAATTSYFWYFDPSGPLSDAEILLRKVINVHKQGDRGKFTLTQDHVAGALRALHTEESLSSTMAWMDTTKALSDSLNLLEKAFIHTQGNKKDKACMTLPTVHHIPRQRVAKKEFEDESKADSKSNADAALRSRSARYRQPKMKQYDAPEIVVDKLLASYKAAGVALPDNFKRTGPTGNKFHFGRKRIELVVCDQNLAVIVGGGFLMLDEFCERHADQMSLSVVSPAGRCGTPTNTWRGSQTPTPRTAYTPRGSSVTGRSQVTTPRWNSGSPAAGGSAATPRAVVRSGRELVMH